MFPRTRLLNFGRHFSRQTRSLATGSGATASIAPNLPRPRLALLGGSCLALLMWTVPIASCAHTEEGVEEGKSSDPGADKLPAGSDEIEKFLRITVYPVCNKLGFGGIMGFCSGIAVKRIGEHVAYMVGIAFIGLQFAQYKGLIDIDWLQVRNTGTLLAPYMCIPRAVHSAAACCVQECACECECECSR